MGSSSLSRFPRHLLAASVLMCSVAVHAGGFDLPTIAASHQGTSNANAIEANDPSVLYYNPAGITRLRGTQLSQSASLLLLRGKVEDRGTTGTHIENVEIDNLGGGGIGIFMRGSGTIRHANIHSAEDGGRPPPGPCSGCRSTPR